MYTHRVYTFYKLFVNYFLTRLLSFLCFTSHMIKSGCGLFDNYENGIICIYGGASTGKTTLAKLAAIEQAKNNKKVIYIDTENGFNLDRIKQLVGDEKEFQRVLENVILFKPKRFSEQNKIIKLLPEMKNISLIIVDTISYFYRAKVREKPKVYNMWIWRQLGILNELSKKIPVIIVNQVYNDISKDKIEMIGGSAFKKMSIKVILLEKGPRRLIFEKPAKDQVKFEIVKEGLKRL